MKVIAIADNIDSLEKLINEYFYSIHYQIVLIRRVNEKSRKLELKYLIENKQFDSDKVALLNLDYTIKYNKGKYYFYKVVSDEKRNI